MSYVVTNYIVTWRTPLADRVAQTLEIIPKLWQRTRILPMDSRLLPSKNIVLITNPMRILVRLVLNWKFLGRISRFCATPPKKLLGSGVSTPYTLFCLICTINSELMYSPIFAHLSESKLISACFQWTGSTPAGFQEAFRAAICNWLYKCFFHDSYWQNGRLLGFLPYLVRDTHRTPFCLYTSPERDVHLTPFCFNTNHEWSICTSRTISCQTKNPTSQRPAILSVYESSTDHTTDSTEITTPPNPPNPYTQIPRHYFT